MQHSPSEQTEDRKIPGESQQRPEQAAWEPVHCSPSPTTGDKWGLALVQRCGAGPPESIMGEPGALGQDPHQGGEDRRDFAELPWRQERPQNILSSLRSVEAGGFIFRDIVHRWGISIPWSGREQWPPQPPSTAEIHSSKHHRVPRGVASCTLPQRLGTAGLVIADPAGPTAASAVWWWSRSHQLPLRVHPRILQHPPAFRLRCPPRWGELGLSSGTGVEKVCSFLLLFRIGAAKACGSSGPYYVLLYQPSPASRRPCTNAFAKSLQCPTLCDPRDGSPPGSPVLEILQARTLE